MVYSLKELLSLYKQRKLSFIEATESYYKHIQKHEPTLHALITLVEKEKVLEQQKKNQKILEDYLRDGKSVDDVYREYPLLGVPVIHKDMFVTKGIRTTAGSKVLDNFIPQYSATVVNKLADAGAVILGKANQDAWAHGSSGENSDFGPTRNPWDTQRVPGGSSSGSATASAIGYAPVVTGTDTGGSIRQPASFTGVVGLKPTYGRVSRFGIVAMASSLDSIGHFTQEVWDSAYVLNVTAGHDPLDAVTSKQKVPNYLEYVLDKDKKESLQKQKVLKGLKVGVLKEFFGDAVDSRIRDMVYQSALELQNYGAKIVEVSIPEAKHGLEIYYILQPAEVASNLARYDGVRYGNPRDHFGDEAKRRIILGNFILSDVVVGKPDATSYIQAAKAKAVLIEKFQQAYQKVDVIVSPVSPTLPFKLGERTMSPLQMYMADLLTVPVSIVGNPGLSVNVGWIDNLPVGLQLFSPNFTEGLLLKLGSLLHVYKRPVLE